MSASMYLSSPYDRLAIEADDETISIFSRDAYGFSVNRVTVRLTSADVAALRIALDAIDTKAADEDLADEQEAA